MATNPHTLPKGAVLDDPHKLPSGAVLDKEPEKQNFFERSSADLHKRFGVQGGEILKSYAQGDQGYMSTVTQLVGKVGAGSILDLLGQAVISGGRGLSAITPDAIEDPLIQNATKAGIALLNTEIGQKGLEAARQGVGAWSEFSEANPVTARNIEAVVNIGLLVAPVKGKPNAAPAGGKTAKALRRSANRSIVDKRREFIEELVEPVRDKKTRIDQVRRTTEQGILRQKVRELSPDQKLSVQELAKIPGISEKKTLQGNYNVIADTVRKKASSLTRDLEGLGSKGKYNWTEFAQEMNNNVMFKLKQNPALVGDSAKSAERVIERALDFSTKNPNTLAGLLKTRKELDAWVLQHKPKAFENGMAANAMTSATRAVRAEINNFIAKRAPSVKVRRSLSAQSRMLRAMDDLAVKAQAESDNIILRGFQNAIKVVPLRNEAVAAMSLVFGVGGLGAAAMFLPVLQKVAFGGAVTYGLGKAAMSPKTRKGLAKLIEIMDKAIRTTSDPSIARQLRLDKAAVIEIIQQSKMEDSATRDAQSVQPQGTLGRNRQ